MRAISSLCLLAALASCTAIDDFGKFTVGSGADMAGGGCTPGCNCIPADPMLGVPDHCSVAPLNSFSCGAASVKPTVTLGPGTYQLDSGATPPVLTDVGGTAVMTGTQMNGVAQFCVASLVADASAHVIVVNDTPVVILADSLIRWQNGSWTLGGGYATDRNGASGFAGGTAGGTNGNAGEGASGGKGGTGSPGTGGGGGGSASAGAPGGVSGGSMMTTPGGVASTMPLAGFGGGAGGPGASFGGGGGGGGGALQLSASWAVVLSAVAFDASGGGGAGGGGAGATNAAPGGGGGGGGGGMIILDAPDVSVATGCLSVIGGPGGAGGASTRGGDAHAGAGCGFVGTPGLAPPSAGGGGVPSGGTMSAGGPGMVMGGGGGGAGGAGRVIVRSRSAPTTAPNVVPMSAYMTMTLP